MTAAAVVVVGDLVTDVVAQLSGPLAPGSDAAAAITFSGGGSGANVAAWLATTGVDVALVARVGRDAAATERSAELQRAGVRAHLATDPSTPTGTVVVLVAADGERTMVPDRGANLRLSVDDLPPSLFRKGAHLHLSGYALLDERPRGAGLHALRLAREHGMTTSVDPSSVEPLRAVGADRWLDWTAGVDVCLPNAVEAAALTGASDPREAALRLGDQYREVVVTMGARGAIWSDGKDAVACAAAPAAVVDTTGAGDAFTAGFLAASRAGMSVRARLSAAADLAGLAVATVGGRPPTGGERTPATGLPASR